MSDLRTLARRMAKLEKTLALEANRIAKTVATEMLKELVLGTPVDTSQALSNWQVGLGAGNYTTRLPFYFGSRGSTYGQSSAQAISVGMAQIKKKAPGQPLHLTNALDYIEALDDGTISRQPGGFVAKAMVAGKYTILNARLKVK